MSTILNILAIWFALSVPVAILTGKFLATMEAASTQGGVNPNDPALLSPSIHQPTHDGADRHGAVQSVSFHLTEVPQP